MEAVKLENIWEDWRIEGKPVGAGSFGTVYKAHKMDKEGFGRDYYSAVKVIRVPSDDSEIQGFLADGMSRVEIAGYYENALKGLISEIDLMESLKGAPNIVIIEDYKVVKNEDNIGWTIYIRMELLKNLNQYRIEHPMEIKDIVRLGIDICSALEYCGKKKIIHRDIKPDNIFINSFGDFKLGDFGIARQLEMTNANLSQKGTSAYMAPEIFRRETYNSSVDIYSLGMVLYRLLNGGRLPFLPTHAAGPEDVQTALEKRLSGEPLPKPAGCDPALFSIIQKACDANMYKRFKSPVLMKAELVKYLEALWANTEEKPEGDSWSMGNSGQENPQGNAPAAAFQEEEKAGSVRWFGRDDWTFESAAKLLGKDKDEKAAAANNSTDEFDSSDDKTVHMFVDFDADKTQGTWAVPEEETQKPGENGPGNGKYQEPQIGTGSPAAGQNGQAARNAFSYSQGAGAPQQIEDEYRQYQEQKKAIENQQAQNGQKQTNDQQGREQNPKGQENVRQEQAKHTQEAEKDWQAQSSEDAEARRQKQLAKERLREQKKQENKRREENRQMEQRTDQEKQKKKRRIIIGCCCGAAVLALGFFTVPVSLKDTLFDKLRYAAVDSSTRAELYVKKGDNSGGSTAIAYYKKALEEDPECLEALIGAADYLNVYDWAEQPDAKDYDDQEWLNLLDILTQIGTLLATPDEEQQEEIADNVDFILYFAEGGGYDLETAISDENPEGLDLMAELTACFAKYDAANTALNGKASMSSEKEYRYENVLRTLNDSGQFPDIEKALLSQALAEFPENIYFSDWQAQINNDTLAQLDASVDEALAAGDTAKAYEICASMQAVDEGYYNDTKAKIDDHVLTATENAINDALNQGNIQGAYDLCATMESVNGDRFAAAKANIQNFENTQNFLSSLKALMDARDYEGMKNTIQADTTYAGNTYYLVDGIYKTSVESGTGLIYDSNGIYYGTIENNTRKGQGCQFRLYSNGYYVFLEGSWDGQANGECTRTNWTSEGLQYTVSGNFTDGYENGAMTISWSSEGYNWTAQYTAVDGTIQTDGTKSEEGKYIYAVAYASDGSSAWWEADDLEGYGVRIY